MKLTEFELDVMQHFWEHGELRSTDVTNIVCASKGVAPNTVRTVIYRLEEKGAITHVRQEGKAFVYAASVKQEDISKDVLALMVRRLFGNSPNRLIAQVVSDNQLDKAQISQLKDMLEHYEGLDSEDSQDKPGGQA